MRFKKVVLPEPLAPTMPTSSPWEICTVILSAALTMPNDLVISMVWRIGLVSDMPHSFGTPTEPRGNMLIHGPQSTRLEQNDEQHNYPQGHLPGIGSILVGICADKLKSNRANERAGHTAISPQEGNKHKFSRLQPEGVFRHNMSDREGYQHAGEPAQGAG